MLTEKDTPIDTDALLDDMVINFQQNFKSVARDLIEGLGWLRFVGTLLLAIALIVTLTTTIFIQIGYYPLGQWYGRVSAGGTLFCCVALVGFYFWIRGQYSVKRKKYADLYRIFDKLDAK